MSWPNDVVMEFLELYKRESIIWDPRHVSHKNRIELNEAWQRIQANISINCTVLDLKKKKESLMTAFRTHFKKKSRTQGEYRTSWFAYNAMESFLGEIYAGDNDNLEQDVFNNSESYESTVDDHQYVGHNTTVIKVQTKPSRASIKQTTPDNKNFAKKRLSTSIYIPKKTDESASYYTKMENAEIENGMDEYDLYCQLLATKLRKLNEHQRDVAMHEIDNIMFRVKTQSVSSQVQNSYPTSPVPRKTKSPLFIITQQGETQYEDEEIPFEQDPIHQPHS